MNPIVTFLFDNLSNPLFASCLAGFITYLMMYVESKINKKIIERKTYIKNILLIMILVGGVVYINANYSMNHPEVSKIVENVQQSIGGAIEATKKINYDTSDIFIGEAGF